MIPKYKVGLASNIEGIIQNNKMRRGTQVYSSYKHM